MPDKYLEIDPGEPSRHAAWRVWLPVTVITALGLTLRLWGINNQSLWSDEISSITRIHTGIGAILAAGYRDEPNPPLYYLLLWGWDTLFGDREIAARMLSALLGAATIPLVYATGVLVAGRRAGAISALLFAGAVIQIEYGQEVRQYALLVFALSIALYGFALALKEAKALPSRAAAGSFVAGIVLATYSHDIAVIFWFAMDLCLLLYLLASTDDRGRRRPASYLFAWGAWNALAVVLCAPQLYAIVLLRNADKVAWIPPTSPMLVRETLTGLLFTYLAPNAEVSIAGLTFACCGVLWAAVANRPRSRALMLGLALPVVAFSIIAIIGIFRPIMLIRTVLFVPVPIYLLVGSALACIETLQLRAVAIAFAFAFEILAMMVHWPSFVKEQWREIVPMVARAGKAGDLFVFVSPGTLMPFKYYWPVQFPIERCRFFADRADAERPSDCPKIDYAAVQTALKQGHIIWLVARWSSVPELAKLDAALSSSFVVQPRQWVSNNGIVMVTRVAPQQ